MAGRMPEAERRIAPLRHAQVTRMTPKRAAEIVDGGSLYWVIKGQISARQGDRRPRAVHGRGRDLPVQAVARRRSRCGRAAPDARLSGLAPNMRVKSAPPGHRREPCAASPPCRKRCGANSPGSGCCKASIKNVKCEKRSRMANSRQFFDSIPLGKSEFVLPMSDGQSLARRLATRRRRRRKSYLEPP